MGALKERQTECPPMFEWLRRSACLASCAALVACLGVQPGEIAWPGSRIWQSPPAEARFAAAPGTAESADTDMAREVERAHGRAPLPDRPVLAEAPAPSRGADEIGSAARSPGPPALGPPFGREAPGTATLDVPPQADLRRPGTAPSSPVAHEYQLYFRLGSSDLDGPSARVLHDLIGNALLIRPSRVLVVGHADRSGDAGYNEELSRQRALTVAARLRAAGIPRERIEVRALGERGPALLTPDGEPSAGNRRVAVRLL